MPCASVVLPLRLCYRLRKKLSFGVSCSKKCIPASSILPVLRALR
jgi:hypothetical protein